eukprot:1136490-Pelagomonas_calceolata.AAC.2
MDVVAVKGEKSKLECQNHLIAVKAGGCVQKLNSQNLLTASESARDSIRIMSNGQNHSIAAKAGGCVQKLGRIAPLCKVDPRWICQNIICGAFKAGH